VDVGDDTVRKTVEKRRNALVIHGVEVGDDTVRRTIEERKHALAISGRERHRLWRRLRP